jgi:hypothetical protein
VSRLDAYERFVEWFIDQNGTRPTWRDTARQVSAIEHHAARKLQKSRHGGLLSRAKERALDNVDRLETQAVALRSSMPRAISPCTCSCECQAACAALENRCSDCIGGSCFYYDPDHRELPLPEPYIGSVFGS